MNVTIQPSKVNGILQAPASKSSMQRACAAALLHNGQTIITNAGKSNDDLAALDIIQKLGATVQINNEELIINNFPNVTELPSVINCGESGLSIRMFTPIAALQSNEITINGKGSLLTRPMNFFDEILPQLNVAVQSTNGKLPIKIKGPLKPKEITIDGSLSSQFLTGLLFAYGKAVTQPTTITVTNLKSKPYIDLTLSVMDKFGYSIQNNNYENFIIKPTHHLPTEQAGKLTTCHYTVEGDWSGAAFLLVAGAIAGNVVVTGLDVFSTQADKAILNALRDCGCRLSVEENKIECSSPPLGVRGFHFNATDCPDLFPPLVALAVYCNGTSVIEGVSRLAHKESNRGLTLQTEFAKMGVEIKLQDDLMIIYGGNEIKGTTVHSNHDHRIAMACAIAALGATGNTIIEEAEAINKSYPNFYEQLKMLGTTISLS
jgi:3-phosphoshikimate 1-carboxyvinyltransferase